MLYWGSVVVLIGNIARASRVCFRVRGELRQTQQTLQSLQTQDRELTHRLTELADEEGRDLEMKKRLYLRKGERWILFEETGKPPTVPPTAESAETAEPQETQAARQE